MAIQITEQPTNPPHNAYNNSIIEFGVDLNIQPEDLYDVNTITSGYYINWNNGEPVALSGYAVTDFIAVNPLNSYVITGASSTTPRSIAYYDSNQVFLSGVENPTEVNIPEDAAFVRFTLNTGYENTTQFLETEIINPTVANITVGGHTFEIFPDAQGEFYFNLKSIIKALINPDNFSDNIEVSHPNIFLYPDASLFYDLQVDIEVVLSQGDPLTQTINYPFIKSVQQVMDKPFVNSSLKLLAPYANDICHLTYFEGYPFDVSIYSDADRAITVNHIKTGGSINISLNKGVNRIFMSNGENDNQGFENELPLYLGVNELEFKIDANTYFTLFLEKREAECGKLIKWFNQEGGWSYWNFMDLYLENHKAGTLERLNREFDNISKSRGNISITGKESERGFDLISGLINKDERRMLESLPISPRAYLYNGELHQPFAKRDFIEVEIGDGTFSKSSKYNKSNLSVEVIQPNIYTQTL